VLRRIGKIAARTAIGAAAGAVATVLIGQVVGLVASSCTVACQPDIAGTAGAIGGALASFLNVGHYEPG
jgi:hypothetical protein